MLIYILLVVIFMVFGVICLILQSKDCEHFDNFVYSWKKRVVLREKVIKQSKETLFVLRG